MSIANELLQSSVQLLEKLKALNAQPNGVYISSIILDLVFQNCSDLDKFMTEFRDGQIAKFTQKTLATDDILSVLNVQSLRILVSVADEDFEEYHKKLQMLDFRKQRNTESKVTYCINY